MNFLDSSARCFLIGLWAFSLAGVPAMNVRSIAENHPAGAVMNGHVSRAATARSADTTSTAADTTAGARSADTTSTAADTTAGAAAVAAPSRPRLQFAASSFDTVSFKEYRRKQSFSLDHFLETEPGFVVGRRGPIGADAVFSRFGIGEGRGTVYMIGIPVNDPQNDLAPLFLLPVSSIQSLVYDPAWSARLAGRSDMEGVIGVVERAPGVDQPFTTIELSKGTNLLRQRRVRFGSARAKLGLDLGYDELLDGGYQFDANQRTGGPDYGKSTARFQTMNLRGELPNDQSFLFSFRWFRDTFQGDLARSKNERRRNGSYAVVSTEAPAWRLLLFQRNYDVFLPDSHTVNHTSAAYAAARPWSTGGLDTEIGLGLENIDAEQTVGGANSGQVSRRGSLGGSAVWRLGERSRADGELNLGHYFEGRTGWGGRFELASRLGNGQELSFELARSFRLPNLGERFLPLHAARAAGIDRIVGNRYLDPETSWETGLSLRLRLGLIRSETRLTSLRIREAIAFRPQNHGGETWLVAENGGSDRLGFLMERLVASSRLRGVEVRLESGLVLALGDRTGDYFAAVPQTRLDALFSLDRDLFQETSGLRLTAEYQYSSDRRTAGTISPSYQLLNLKLAARLLEADLFIHWLNVLDETYTSEWPYLMTPRTFVYGIQWTLFD
jgi:hypothetical protein